MKSAEKNAWMANKAASVGKLGLGASELVVVVGEDEDGVGGVAALGKSRGVDGPRVKRHGAIVYNKRRRSARGVGASELVVDEVRTASAVTMGKKEQGGGHRAEAGA